MKNYLLTVMQMEELPNQHMLGLFQELVTRFTEVIQEKSADEPMS